MLAAIKNWLTKAEPRQEGGRIQGPLAPGQYPDARWIPMSWPLNFWQCGSNVLLDTPPAIVDACVWAYVAAIAQLPGYHRRLDEEENGEIETITTSALSRLLRYPNTYQTRSDFLTHGIRSLLYRGNWYSLAIRNARNEVVELHWLNPALRQVIEISVPDQPVNEIFYSVGSSNPILNWQALRSALDLDQLSMIPQRDMFHVKLATPRNPLIGESPLAALAFDIANRAGMAASLSNFFRNASRPSGVLKTDMQLTKQQADELRARWNEVSTGLNTGGVPILTHGLNWQALSLSNEDAQLVDYLKLSDATICGVFGVPGILVGVSGCQTFSTTEAVMNYWLANRLGYVIDHIETAIDQFIGLPADEYTEYDTDALLRTDLRTRIEALARGIQGGIYAPNEARRREGLKAAEAGDEPRVQQQVVPLSFATNPPPKPAAPARAPAIPPAPAPPAAGDQPSKSVSEYERDLELAA